MLFPIPRPRRILQRVVPQIRKRSVNFFWIWRNLSGPLQSDLKSGYSPPEGTAEWLEYTGAPVSESDVMLWLPGGAFYIAYSRSRSPCHCSRGWRLTWQCARILVFRYSLPAKLKGHAFPAAPGQVDEVLHWLRTSCGMSRVILAGDSAGGFLTVEHYLETCVANSTKRVAPIDAAIAFYPVLDLTLSSKSIETNANKDGLHRNLLVAGVNSFTSGHDGPGTLQAWSPVTTQKYTLFAAMKPDQPRLCLISGALDLLAGRRIQFLRRGAKGLGSV